MKTNRVVGAALALLGLLSCAALPAWADRDDRHDYRRGEVRRNDGRRDDARYIERGWVQDKRYHHNHYYPPRGNVVPVLPHDHRTVIYRNTRYYYHGGAWYRPSGSRFIVVLPPVGLIVPILPPFYTTIWYGGMPYYYAGGVYYVWRPEERVYVVADPPPESAVSEQAAVADELYVYPKQGQSEQQQATDRYQCHRWAVGQTGFDPTQPGGNVPEAQHADKRDDYQRAMKACLEGRGYSVR